MVVNVRNGGEVSDTFAITNVVNQECILAPTLLSIFPSAMLVEAWGTESTLNQAKMQTSLQLHTSERRQKPQICQCQCIIKVWPEDQHKKDISDVPTELYNDHEGGH